MYTLRIELRDRVYEGAGETPEAAWRALVGFGRSEPALQQGYGLWVRDAASKFAADPDLREVVDINRYEPRHRARMTRE